MQFQAILFDLDGTLLPMDNDVFVKGYFQELSKKLCPVGMAPEPLIAAVWAGTKAMVKNDGSRKNEEVFWEVFAAAAGVDAAPFRAASDDFYTNEFHAARACTSANPHAVETLRLAHACAGKVVLSSNPLFPRSGQLTRLSWVGLGETDFDLITSYETDCFCKPNPEYFRSVCARIGADPAQCLLIGNDEEEDMLAGASIGLQCFLLTDTAIRREAHPWHGRSGNTAELLAFLREQAGL